MFLSISHTKRPHMNYGQHRVWLEKMALRHMLYKCLSTKDGSLEAYLLKQAGLVVAPDYYRSPETITDQIAKGFELDALTQKIDVHLEVPKVAIDSPIVDGTFVCYVDEENVALRLNTGQFYDRMVRMCEEHNLRFEDNYSHTMLTRQDEAFYLFRLLRGCGVRRFSFPIGDQDIEVNFT